MVKQNYVHLNYIKKTYNIKINKASNYTKYVQNCKTDEQIM